MRPNEDPVARRSPAAVAFFGRIMRRQVRDGFRALRLARPGLPPLPAGRPLLIYTNHPSWWDPAVLMVLHLALFPGREGYAPIAAEMLERYSFFRRLGLFGLPPGRAGAAAFLQTAARIWTDPSRILWVTAQGRLADPRERPLGLRPGVAHLLARHKEAVALPLALEYPFWTERRPEALAAFGTPLAEGRRDAAALEGALTAACDRLAALSLARDPAAFATLLGGRRGVGGVWGVWERARAAWHGRPHVPDHRPDPDPDRDPPPRTELP